MDIKVNIDGVYREVCGITEATTCEEVIFKLAQIASLPGFYTLVGKFGEKEVTLAPDERITNFIKGTKENPANICFILRRLEAPSPFPSKAQKHGYSVAQGYSQVTHPSARQSQFRLGYKNKDVYSPSSSISPPKPQYNPMGQASNLVYHNSSVDAYQPLSSTGSNEEKVNHDGADQYNQLKDQLASQEQQVELNRIRLLRLDKEIAQLEQMARSDGKISNTGEFLTGSTVGPVAELAQLAATPWSQLLDTNQARQRELLSECERHKIAIDQVDTHLAKTKLNLSQLENQIGQELSRLLSELEAYNQLRRNLLKSMSGSHGRSQVAINQLDSNSDGVAV